MTETVVVVGATGEMGRAICRDLLARDYDVLAIARSDDALTALAGDLPGLRCCVADISSDDAIEAIRAELVHDVRGVVHGPGVATAGGALTAPTSAVVDAVNIKVGGFMRLARAVHARLQRQSRLIAIGGHYGFEPSAYAATAGVANAALANLVRQFSWAYGERGVTAHLLVPGPADTPRLRRVADARAERDGITTEDVLESMRGESAIGQFTTLESVAWAVTMLLDPRADAMAGGPLYMDSGRRHGIS